MAKNRETATSFTLDYLTKHADRELQIKDLHEGCEGQFSVPNIQQSLIRLLGEGKVIRTRDGKAAWWALNTNGQTDAIAQPDVAEPKQPKKPSMTIKNARW
jgi:hypothetical protein